MPQILCGFVVMDRIFGPKDRGVFGSQLFGIIIDSATRARARVARTRGNND